MRKIFKKFDNGAKDPGEPEVSKPVKEILKNME